MTGLFASVDSCNQDISRWDVSRVLLMSNMFTNTDSLNQDIGNWDVSRLIRLFGMFANAKSFNQDLSGWCVSSFPVEPSSFDDGATAWTEAKPVWGTCPN